VTTPTQILAPSLTASRADLPAAVVAALDDPTVPELGVVDAAGIPFATRAWGDPTAAPILLIHGVTASSRVWWRIGPALAAGLDCRVVAVDQPGHGLTPPDRFLSLYPACSLFDPYFAFSWTPSGITPVSR
jgi:pimeloyl-ACP methyl ester carboxylesterase